MEKLTKEAFWNEVYSKYTAEVQVFCNWIDEYKKRVRWGSLFREAPFSTTTDKGNTVTIKRLPKYHDLPIAMQIGIFIQFTFESDKHHDFFEGTGPADMDGFIAGMKDWFFYEHDAARVDHLTGKYDSDDNDTDH